MARLTVQSAVIQIRSLCFSTSRRVKSAMSLYLGGWLQTTTSTHVPFPELAQAIHGANTEEIIETLRELGQVVTRIHHVKQLQTEWNIDPDYANILFTIIDMEFVNRARDTGNRSIPWPTLRHHCLSRVDAEKTLDFLHTHSDRLIDDPERVVLTHSGREITAAERWIAQCLVQNHKPDHSLRLLWSRYLEEQPQYDPPETPKERFESTIQELDDQGSPVCFPDLAQVLQIFAKADSFDEQGVVAVLREYLSLSVTAAELWACVWRHRGIQRGRSLEEDDYLVELLLEDIEDAFIEKINNWQDETPLYIRQIFAKHCFGCDFLFLTNHVFPRLIAPTGSHIREDMFAKEMHQFIVTAATSPDVDPHGRIRSLIEERGWHPDVRPDGTYRQPQSIGSFATFLLIEDDETIDFEYDLEDVELEAYGPLIDVEDISNSCVPNDGSMCTVCQEEFTVEDSECVETKACGHQFHSDCLNMWANGAYENQVLCPVCRANLCAARPRRIKIELNQESS